MTLTAEDITKIIRLYFAKEKQIKLWRNEPHKKLLQGEVRFVKGIGYPPGTPDTMGWRVGDCVVCGVEIKTINDSLSKTQKDVMTMIVNDGGLAYVARQRKNDLDHIELENWSNHEKIKIDIADYL